MKRAFIPALIGLLLAVVASFVTYGGYGHYRFYAHDHVRKNESEDVKRVIKHFSASYAGFYATDGYLEGLNAFPAENMVKRRLFHDIRNWEANNKLLVWDRDKSLVRKVTFPAPDLAVVLVDESWFNVFQDRVTRRQISDKKAVFITVRYYLKKQWSRWVIWEYEVFKKGDPIPPVLTERIIRW